MTNERGFTIIEVLIAVVVLTVGVMAMVTTAALTTRMITQGQIDTESTALAAQQFEIVRGQAGCPAAGAGGTSTAGPYALKWSASAIGFAGRQITLEIAQPSMRGTVTRTYTTTLFCGI